MKLDERALTKALINQNNFFMESLPAEIELHNFSGKFEKKMNRLIVADKKYGGKIWLQRAMEYTAKAAVIAVCLVTVNFISVKAFHLDLWKMIFSNSKEFIQINFEKETTIAGTNESGTAMSSNPVRLKIKEVPNGYTLEEDYGTDEMTVQYLVSEKGSITYTESLITETANVNIAQGTQQKGVVGNYQVSYIIDKDKVTAFFCDDEFYHIVEIEGEDANKSFADEIIKKLEAK